ncbi:hypothetical protein OUZ56_022749 [Daphnia magna]|uniref:Uncharacterized protein n=1 Tax=Daphnia magna TaxID=35525 RepID=A0ABR0AXC5_9CRUS|nr:hypothetical protein OUZ56_022749 [Daphnia magna]
MKKTSREWGLYGKLFQTSAVCDSPCIFILRVSRTDPPLSVITCVLDSDFSAPNKTFGAMPHFNRLQSRRKKKKGEEATLI